MPHKHNADRRHHIPKMADRGFQGPALGDLGYRGKHLAEAGQALGITVDAIARGRDGQFVPAGMLGC